MAYCCALLSGLLAVLLVWRSSAEDYANPSNEDRGLPLAPGNLQYQVEDDNSVTLNWQQPASIMDPVSTTVMLSRDNAYTTESPTHQEEYILSFIIELSAKGTRTVRKPVFASKTAVGLQVEGDGAVPEGVGFENEYLLLHLNVGVEYTVRIAATNEHGIGPYSDSLTVRTDNTNYELEVGLYTLMALVALVLLLAVGSLILLSRCPKQIVVVSDSGGFEGHSPDANPTRKADYATEEGCVEKSRGQCNQFNDTKPASEDGNSDAATAITVESPEGSSEVTESETNSKRVKEDVVDTQHRKKHWLCKTSFSQLFSRWRPQTVLGVHIRVNPVQQSTVETKLVPWTHSFSESARKEFGDSVCLHTRGEAKRENPQHVCVFV